MIHQFNYFLVVFRQTNRVNGPFLITPLLRVNVPAHHNFSIESAVHRTTVCTVYTSYVEGMGKLVNLLNPLDGDFGGGVVAPGRAAASGARPAGVPRRSAVRWRSVRPARRCSTMRSTAKTGPILNWRMGVGLAADCARLIAWLVACT